MKFNWVLFNHSDQGKSTFFDIVNGISTQLMDLGHEVHRNDKMMLEPPFINIIFEGFDPWTNEVLLKEGFDKKYNIICIQTEQHGHPGFNSKPVDELVMRQKFFVQAIPMITGVWCLVPGEARWAARFQPHSHDLNVGWSPIRRELVKTSINDPIYDFVFYGGYTPRRKNLFQIIESKGYSIYRCTEYGNIKQRDAEVGMAKVVLAPKPHSKWELISGTRLTIATHIGRPVITEPHKSDSVYKKIYKFSRSYHTYIDEAIAMLPNWQAEWEKQRSALETLLPAENCMIPALEATILNRGLNV